MGHRHPTHDTAALCIAAAAVVLLGACEDERPPDCETTLEAPVAATDAAALGFAWVDVQLPLTMTVPGAYEPPVDAVTEGTPELTIAVSSLGALRATEMVAHEPSHFSGWSCTSRLTRAASATVSTTGDAVVGGFQGEIMAFSPTRYVIVLEADAAAVLAAEDAAAFDRVDLVVDVADGVGDFAVIGVRDYEEQTDQHGGVSSGGELTTLFRADGVAIEKPQDG